MFADRKVCLGAQHSPRRSYGGGGVTLSDRPPDALFLPRNIDEELGMMIQCEMCRVWQHGICVGFQSEDECPETYYCEQCRPDMHADLLANRYALFVLSGPLTPLHRLSLFLCSRRTILSWDSQANLKAEHSTPFSHSGFPVHFLIR